jgi:undecaprenyl-diphosphatase
MPRMSVALPRTLVRALRGPDLRLLLAVVALVAGIWAFAELADEVSEGDSRTFDEAVLLAARDPVDPGKPRGPDWLGEAALDVTALGGTTVLGLVILAVAGLALVLRKPHMALLLLAAGGGGMLVNTGLKNLFDRTRPTVVPQLDAVHTLSFPSGHAMVSAAVYLSLAVLAARLVRPRHAKVYVVAVAATLTVAVGVTRVYLGVHYPTDVLAGWIAGGLWALLCGVVALLLQRSGAVEQPGPEPGAGAGDRDPFLDDPAAR